MAEKNVPDSYELEDTGTYESCYRMVKHEPLAFYTHGDWVEYEGMVEELHGAALWIDALESSHAELLEAAQELLRVDSLFPYGPVKKLQAAVKRATEEK